MPSNEGFMVLRRSVCGFTLIELMLVVAVIGLLSALAVPMVADYSRRARISEVVLAASACRTVVSEIYQQGGTTPGANGWGCERLVQSSRYVARVETDANGVVTVTATALGDGLDGRKLQLVPYHAPGVLKSVTETGHLGSPVVRWTCGPASPDGLPLAVLPSSCHDA